MENSNMKKYLAELFGTFVLVFMGCGSAVLAGNSGVLGGIGLVGIALTFGFSVLVMVYAIGGISGCHINPAISIAMYVSGKMKAQDAAVYMVCQCIGAIIAAGLLLSIATGIPSYSLAANGLGQNGYGIHSPGGYSLMACFIAEVVFTMIFLIVIFGATSAKAPAGFAGIAIGISLAMIHLVGIPITGVSVNPARSLGPALLVGGDALGQVWLFWLAPIIGALIAAVIWKYGLEDTAAGS
jgi:aquaporin Z